MLVLSRRTNESIEFPELGIVIRVKSLKNRKVHLGIEAPRTIKIRRSELGREPADAPADGNAQKAHIPGARFSSAEPRTRSSGVTDFRTRGTCISLCTASWSQRSSRIRKGSFERIHRLLFRVDDAAPMDDDLWSTNSRQTKTCVRQSPARFTVCNARRDHDASVIDHNHGPRATWGSFRNDRKRRAIA